MLFASQVGTVAAVAEKAAAETAATVEKAAAVKAATSAETAAAVKAAASAETAAAVEAAVKTAEIAAAVKAAEASASVKMAAAVEAAVKAAQKQIKTLKSQLKETKEEMKELQVAHKGRSERAVALEKATAAMTLAQLKKELESRRMCSYGRAPDLKQRLVLELAGRCQSDSIGLHSAAAAAVTAAMSAMQKQLQPQLESVRSGVAVVASTALRLLGGDTDEFDEAIAEMSIALDEA